MLLKIKTVLIKLVIFLISFFIFLQMIGLIYFINLNYENTFYKFNKMSFLPKIYKDINIKIGNCSFINEYSQFKIDISPILHDKNSLDELIEMTEKCYIYKNDNLFLLSLNKSKLNLPKDEEESINLISKYWYFIPENKKNNLAIFFKEKKSLYLIDLFLNYFK